MSYSYRGTFSSVPAKKQDELTEEQKAFLDLFLESVGNGREISR